MNRYLLLFATLVLLAPQHATAQVAVFDDFGDYFDGEGVYPSFQWWSGGGVGGGTNPFADGLPQAISTDGLLDQSGESSQAWKIHWDTTESTDYYFWYTGNGFSYGPEFRAAGITEEQGATDPGNWIISLDVRAVGALGDLALTGEFSYFDSDYEAVYGVDVDGNGDMLGGATTYRVGVNFYDNDGDPNDFTSNSLRLDSGTPTTDVAGDIPRFNNDGNWVLSLNGGGGEYAFGDYSVTIDNFMIEFSEKPSVPGDYNDDSVVDAADYTLWRDSEGQMITLLNEGEGVTPGEVTIEDYYFWRSQFGNTVTTPVASTIGVPEPCGVVLTMVAACAALAAGRSRWATCNNQVAE